MSKRTRSGARIFKKQAKEGAYWALCLPNCAMDRMFSPSQDPGANRHEEGSAKKMKQGAGKRLNDKQRVEIIQIAENSKISKRQLADKYGVSEAAIRKLLLKKDDFLKRYYDTPEEIRDQRL
ncbi:hypothetical protein BBJ28_00024976, partial [Nothophytophthora sp. Chile5]